MVCFAIELPPAACSFCLRLTVARPSGDRESHEPQCAALPGRHSPARVPTESSRGDPNCTLCYLEHQVEDTRRHDLLVNIRTGIPKLSINFLQLTIYIAMMIDHAISSVVLKVFRKAPTINIISVVFPIISRRAIVLHSWTPGRYSLRP